MRTCTIRNYVIFRSTRLRHTQAAFQFKEINILYILPYLVKQSFLSSSEARCHLRYLPAHDATYVRALINGIVRFHCDLIESRVIAPGGLRGRKLLTAGYTEVKPTFVVVLAPTDSTYDPIPRDNATRHVHSSRDPGRAVDFLRLHFRLSRR